jgi:hypothetical protein
MNCTPLPELKSALAFLVVILLLAVSAPGASVRDFGALGDGQTDDTAAIQAAIDQAEGLIDFPPGDYRITRPLVIDLGQRGRSGITGRQGVARLMMAGPGPAIRIRGSHGGTAGPDTFGPGVYARERMPQIDGIEITGTHPEADGIEASGTMQLLLRGVLATGLRHGIRLTGRNRNVIIQGVHVYACRGAGIFFERLNLHQVIIEGSHISYCHQGGIRVEKSEIRNLEIVGNDIEYNYDPATNEDVCDILLDAREGNIREGTISGNNIQAVTYPPLKSTESSSRDSGSRSQPAADSPPASPRRLGANVRLIGADGPNRVGKFTISGNLISSRLYNIDLVDARGVSVSGNNLYAGQERSIRVVRSRQIVVAGNVIDRNPLYEARVRADSRSVNGILVQESDGVLLSANQIEAADAGSPEQCGAIEIHQSQAVTVNACQIFEPRYRGIHVRESRNLIVSDCMILDRSQTPAMTAAVVLQRVEGAVVNGNLVSRGTAGDIVTDGDATVALSTNRVIGNRPAAR